MREASCSWSSMGRHWSNKNIQHYNKHIKHTLSLGKIIYRIIILSNYVPYKVAHTSLAGEALLAFPHLLNYGDVSKDGLGSNFLLREDKRTRARELWGGAMRGLAPNCCCCWQNPVVQPCRFHICCSRRERKIHAQGVAFQCLCRNPSLLVLFYYGQSRTTPASKNSPHCLPKPALGTGHNLYQIGFKHYKSLGFVH